MQKSAKQFRNPKTIRNNVKRESFRPLFFILNCMRLDLFLKTSRLAIRRSVAQSLCSEGLITVNDVVARSSKEVKEGDIIVMSLPNIERTIKISRIPKTKQVSKNTAPDLYEIVDSVEKADLTSRSDQ